jgi:hypothetical protein
MLRGSRILVATVAIGLAGSAFGEQALAVELPPPPPAPETAVPTVDAAEVPALPPAESVVEPPLPQVAVADVEQAAQKVVAAAPAAPQLPSVGRAPAEKAASAPPAGGKTVESGTTVRRTKSPARPKPRPASAPRETAAGKDTNRTVSASTSAAERRVEVSSLLPREAGAVPQRPPHSLPGGAGTALLQGASGGGPLPAAALSAPFDVSPDAGTRVVPVSTLLRRTLVKSFLERPG